MAGEQDKAPLDRGTLTGSYYGDSVATNVPVFGKGVSIVKSGTFLQKDIEKGDAVAIAADVGALASDCSGFMMGMAGAAASIAADPLGWLINQGLSFLINVCQPLKDAIHLVTGDPVALKNAAGYAGDVAKGLVQLAKDLEDTFEKNLGGWGGQASDAASKRLGEFVAGVEGAAGKAGNLGRALQLSAMVMEVAEEFIKGLLTDLVEWLIVTWLAALAAAPVTFGASTAAAGAATPAEAAVYAGRAEQKVSKLTKIINKIKELIAKLQRWLKESKIGQKFTDPVTGKGGKALTKAQDAGLAKATKNAGGPITRDTWRETMENSSSLTGSLKSGFGTAVKDSAKKQGQKLVGMDKTEVGSGQTGTDDGKLSYTDPTKIAGKAGGYAKGVNKGVQLGNEGEDQDTGTTHDNLDI